jgi:Transposase DDE domain
MMIDGSALTEVLSNRFGLWPSRAVTLGWLVRLITEQGSVCMHRLAANIATDAQLASVRQRLRRFFEQVTLDEAAGARLLADQLGLCGKHGWDLQVDRTNWDFGDTTHNVLTLSVLWNGTAIPLFWIMLDKEGNSDTDERTNLLQKVRDVFPDQRIASLTGDREFVGHKWLICLAENNIPFVMRHRENMFAFRDGQEAVQLKWLARNLKPNETLNLKGGWRIGRTERDASPPVFLAIRRLKDGSLLILAASFSAKRALATYRLRWKIETLFGLLKTKGFNLEDTHMKDPKRLSTLLSILAIAAALVVKTGQAAHRIKPIAIKKHGRPARSVFALGLDTLRRYFAKASLQKIFAAILCLIAPKTRSNPLLSLGIVK